MKKTLLLLLAASSLFATSTQAQNLLVNGDFETGTLAPWVGGNIVPTVGGGFSASTIGSLSQAVATTPGKQYLVSADVSISSIITTSAALTAVPTGGGAPDGTRTITSTTPVPTVTRVSLFFTASTASTTITFSLSPIPGFIGSLTLDNATMLQVEPSKITGIYSGTNLVTLKLTTPELANKATRKVTATVNAENEIYILDGAQAILSGVILNDGTFTLTTGFGLPQGTGTAKIQGKRIELEFTATSLVALDPKGAFIPNVVTNKIVLTRK